MNIKQISSKFHLHSPGWNFFTLNGNFWNWKCGKVWLSVARAVVEGGKKKKKLISINWHLWIVFTDSTRATSEPILVIGFAVDLERRDCLHHLCELAPFSSWLLQTFSQLQITRTHVCSGLPNLPEKTWDPPASQHHLHGSFQAILTCFWNWR